MVGLTEFDPIAWCEVGEMNKYAPHVYLPIKNLSLSVNEFLIGQLISLNVRIELTIDGATGNLYAACWNGFAPNALITSFSLVSKWIAWLNGKVLWTVMPTSEVGW